MRLQTKQQRLDYQAAQIKAIQERNPLGFIMERIADLVIVNYVSQFRDTKKPCIKIWKTNSAHPFANYYFHSLEQRQDYIDKQIAASQAHLERKAEKQQKRREFRHSLKVGDILVDSWGYDQTNIDYFQVVRAEEFFVTVRAIGAKRVPGSDGFMCCTVKPDKDNFIGPPQRKKVCQSNSIKTHSFSWARLCKEDSEHYNSWYA
jgi:hypothetical protein